MSGEMGRVRVTLAGFTGGPGVASFYYRGPGAINWDFIVQDILDGVLAAFVTAGNLFPTPMTFTVQNNIDLIDPHTGELLETKSGTGASTTGSATTFFGPLASGLCVQWNTAAMVHHRHLRGRTFLVPLDAALGDANGTPNSAAIADANAFGAAITALSPGGAQQVIWSRPTFTEPGHTIDRAGTDSPVTGHTVADKFCVLRSRRD